MYVQSGLSKVCHDQLTRFDAFEHVMKLSLDITIYHVIQQILTLSKYDHFSQYLSSVRNVYSAIYIRSFAEK